MNKEEEFFLGRFSRIIGLVILVGVLILWMKPRTKADCESFQPALLAKACLSELPDARLAFQPYVTPPATPPLKVTLARIKFTSTKLEAAGSGNDIYFVLTGNLHNLSATAFKDIHMTINYYNFGDDPNKIPPFARYDLVIRDILPAGQVKSIREVVSNNTMHFPATSFSWDWQLSGAQAVDSTI